MDDQHSWDNKVKLSDVITSTDILSEDDIIAAAMRASRILSTLVQDGYDEIKDMIFRLIKDDDLMLDPTLCLMYRMAIRIKAKGTKDNPVPITLPAMIDEYKKRHHFNFKDLPNAKSPDEIGHVMTTLLLNYEPYRLFTIAHAEVRAHVQWYVSC